jgi:hypothetical protein
MLAILDNEKFKGNTMETPLYMHRLSMSHQLKIIKPIDLNNVFSF